jgi:hypothetical protein
VSLELGCSSWWQTISVQIFIRLFWLEIAGLPLSPALAGVADSANGHIWGGGYLYPLLLPQGLLELTKKNTVVRATKLIRSPASLTQSH